MPSIDTSLLPQGTDFVIRLAPLGGWPPSSDGTFGPAKADIAQALEARFGPPFEVTGVNAAQQHTDYHMAPRDADLSGYHIAKTISNEIENTLYGQLSDVPDINVTVLPHDVLHDLIGYSEARNRRSR
jgi:hypothetical protein